MAWAGRAGASRRLRPNYLQYTPLGTSLPAIGPKELWARPSRGISSGRWTTPHAAPPSRTAQYPRRPIIGGRRDGTEPIRAARPSLSLRPRADRDGTSRLSRHCHATTPPIPSRFRRAWPTHGRTCAGALQARDAVVSPSWALGRAGVGHLRAAAGPRA